LLAADVRAEAAIRAADSVWAEAIASKLLEQTVAMYDPEAVTAGPAMFPARGRDAFRAEWKQLFSRPDFSLAWSLDTIIVLKSGTMAYSTGTWRAADPNSTGPYLAVWRKQRDGQWKVLIDAAWFSRPAESDANRP